MMDMSITVVIPTIGRTSLEKAVSSVNAQSLQKFEIIIVDDSTSQTTNIEGASVVRTGGKRGVSFARNLGVDAAKGKFIAFLDDDDLWLPNKLREQLDEFRTNNCDILLSSASVNLKIRPNKSFLLREGRAPLELIYGEPHIFRSKSYLPTASFMVKKEVFDKVKFREDLIDRENILFLQNAFESGFRIKQTREVQVQINYLANDSLARMTINSEISWFNYLNSHDEKFAQNFMYESARNYVRQKKYDDALKILNLKQGHKFVVILFTRLVKGLRYAWRIKERKSKRGEG